MSDVKTRKIDRVDLAKFLPTPSLIKDFENLIQDVATNIPDLIEGNTDAAEQAIAVAQIASQTAEAIRSAASRLASVLADLQAEFATQRDQSTEVTRLRQRVDQIEAILATTRPTNIDAIQKKLDDLYAAFYGA